MIYLDAIGVKRRRDSRIESVAVHIVLGVDMEGRKDALGHWIGDGAEGTTFWMSLLRDLQARGVQDVLIACMDEMSGFSEAIQAVFPKTMIQRCILHPIHNSLKYVVWKGQDEFVRDLKAIYQAATRELAETVLLTLSEKWASKYAVAVRGS